MLSQQEHEEEVQRKRADEVKMQIALEQSKTEGQPNVGLVDLATTDPWGASSASNTDSDDFFPSLPSKGGLIDPWAPQQKQQQSKPSNGLAELDPWAPTTPSTTNGASKTQTNPWETAQAKDPWSTSGPSQSAKLDEFDLFTNNRVASTTSPVLSTNASGNAKSLDLFGDFLGGGGDAVATPKTADSNSTNPWNSTKSNPAWVRKNFFFFSKSNLEINILRKDKLLR